MSTSSRAPTASGQMASLSNLGAAVAVGVFVLTIVSGGSAAAGLSNATDSNVASGPGLAALNSSLSTAIDLRSKLGLRDDPGYVAALEADASASRQYGIAM